MIQVRRRAAGVVIVGSVTVTGPSRCPDLNRPWASGGRSSEASPGAGRRRGPPGRRRGRPGRAGHAAAGQDTGPTRNPPAPAPTPFRADLTGSQWGPDRDLGTTRLVLSGQCPSPVPPGPAAAAPLAGTRDSRLRVEAVARATGTEAEAAAQARAADIVTSSECQWPGGPASAGVATY